MKNFIFSLCFIVASAQIGCSGNPSENSSQGPSEKVKEKPEEKTIRNPNLAEVQTARDENTSSASNKIALIVAVGNYSKIGDYDYITPATRAWANISSDNDVPLIKEALHSQGFKDEDIKIIEDKDATKDGIINAIRKDLIDRATAGGIAVFHYSGHGQQVMDNDGDEVDGYDEALVPSNAPIKFVEGVYEGQYHLRDEELGKLFEELRLKLGPEGHLLAILDACHSGTGTRGLALARGTQEKCAPESYIKNHLGKKDDNNGTFGLQSKSRGATESKDLASFVVISGASADELNYETRDETGKGVGSLSYAFSRAIVNESPNASYAGLFDKIKLDMSSYAPRQTPQIEGDVNAKVLNGKTIERPSHFKVTETPKKGWAVIDAGELLGLFPGTTVTFFEVDQDTAGAKPKATGVIKKTELTKSFVELDKAVPYDQLLSSWVYVERQNFGNMEVKARLAIMGNEPLKKAIEEELGKASLIKLVDSHPDIQIEMGNTSKNQFAASRGAGYLQILTSNDYVYYEKKIDENNVNTEAKEVTREAIAYAQAKFLRNLELDNPDLAVNFEFVPVTVETQAWGDVEIKDTLKLQDKISAKDHMIEFHEGDYFLLKVTSKSQKDVYISALDIQPDNKINPLFPTGNRAASEYKIAAGSTVILPDRFSIGPPYGVEVFKLLATETPVDLRPLIKTRGQSARGNTAPANPLELLLADTYKSDDTQMRGAASVSVPPSSGYIQTIIFRIAK